MITQKTISYMETDGNHIDIILASKEAVNEWEKQQRKRENERKMDWKAYCYDSRDSMHIAAKLLTDAIEYIKMSGEADKYDLHRLTEVLKKIEDTSFRLDMAIESERRLEKK